MRFFTERRRRYFVDSQVQGALVRQIAKYWIWTSITFALVVLVYRVTPVLLSGRATAAEHFWFHLSPLLLASSVVFPLIIFSAVRFSNRFVGPVLRFRRALQELADGKTPQDITLRKNDYWTDMAENINRLAREREGQRPVINSPQAMVEPEEVLTA